MPADTDSKTLQAAVKVVAAPWEESPYYADAEHWTSLFWDAQTSFRQCFDRLDLASVVELACGFGRHAERIVPLAGELILIDVFEKNLDACRERLAHHDTVRYQLGNGYDFQPLDADSVTAVLCYDAMVHFNPEIVASYLRDGQRILQPGGQMLLHHSNYDTAGDDRHYGLNPHARNHMTFELFQSLSAQAGLEIVSSVPLNWGDEPALDRLSLLRKH